MIKAGFTITTKKGTAFDADVICATFEDYTMTPQVSFVCSGRQMVMPASEIEKIEFNGGANNHCSHCDQALPVNALQKA